MCIFIVVYMKPGKKQERAKVCGVVWAGPVCVSSVNRWEERGQRDETMSSFFLSL